ncbi:MAG TPA: hypothetical protein O0X50_04055 [Methanocorpusculum sp.]|nr:hypothetical protein [Methanocorpusculum sp.]
MQSIAASDEAYRISMRFCSKSGGNASSVLKVLVKYAEEAAPDKKQLAALERDCAKAIRGTKHRATHEEVFRRVI